ncbi:MAG: Maf family protein [Clostridiales bacterium]|nr:Maf family protein [Clostridiales bacterium]
MSIILASQSPRRRALLEQMGITDFTVLPAKGQEDMSAELTPEHLVETLALTKGREVAGRTAAGNLVIAADTVVALHGEVLGKPRDEADAYRMLQLLSGETHAVHTGVAVLRDGQALCEHETTLVRFRPLSDREIRAYIATGEPMDKAGAYGIQGRGAVLVEGIQGDYCNVVGLPVCRLSRMLETFGVRTLG